METTLFYTIPLVELTAYARSLLTPPERMVLGVGVSVARWPAIEIGAHISPHAEMREQALEKFFQSLSEEGYGARSITLAELMQDVQNYQLGPPDELTIVVEATTQHVGNLKFHVYDSIDIGKLQSTGMCRGISIFEEGTTRH